METKNLGKVCFILCGGGAKGAVQIGQLQALIENNIIPDYIIGISVGALNGAKIIESVNKNTKDEFLKAIEELKKIWEHITSRSKILYLNNPIQIARRKTVSLFNPSPLTKLVENLNAEQIVKSNIRFDVIVSKITSVKEIVFSNREGGNKLTKENCAKVILASSSIPGLFPPVEINGEFYFDGAMTAPLPVFLPAKNDYDSVFILSTDFPPNKNRPKSEIKNWIDGLAIGNEISRDKLKLMDWNWTRNVNKNLKAIENLYESIIELVKKEIPGKIEIFKNVLDEKIKEFRFIQKRRIEIYYIYPTQLPPTLQAFNFNSEDIKNAINEGYRDAIRILEEYNLI